MIEQEVTCEGDLFPLCHDFCLAALDPTIDTFFRTGNLQDGATKFISEQSWHPQTQQDETPSAWSEGMTS